MPDAGLPRVYGDHRQPGFHRQLLRDGRTRFNRNAPPPPAPFIWSEVPSTAIPGQTLNVYFTGLYTKWDPNPISGTQFSFGSGIQVNTCQVTSQTSALCNITITATTAQTNEVVFTTGSETESAYFNVVIAQPV